MKKYIYIIGLCLASNVAMAQDTYESVELASSDLNGTARFVGMGGALGALGSDITTMGTNPAGTALFRHNEVNIGVSGVFTDTKGQLGHDQVRMSLDHAGILFVMGQGEPGERGLQSVNFGINYLKKCNYLGNIAVGSVAGLGAGNFSQTWQIADMANLTQSNGYDWPVLADIFAPKNEKMDDGVLGYDSGKFHGVNAESASYHRATYGSSSQFDFNLSFNISDQFFWGLSLGVYSNNYRQQSLYYEMGVDKNYYDILNWYDSKADGFDVKLGFICRPIEESPFRIGLAIHTPIWYSMDDVNGWSLCYNDGDDEKADGIFGYTEENQADPFRYGYRTPWKFAVSLGHTIGKELAFGLEYELTDPSTARYYTEKWDRAPYFEYINDKIKHSLKAQHTLKMGLEYKFVPEIALRMGYNYVSSPIKNTSYRQLYAEYDTWPTETAYINWKDLHRLTFGMGYRFKGGYFDLAIQYQMQKGDLYAFYGDYQDKGVQYSMAPTEVKNNRAQILGTLGFSF